MWRARNASEAGSCELKNESVWQPAPKYTSALFGKARARAWTPG
jgi:hypothetical protein